jgi:hypothetical protein
MRGLRLGAGAMEIAAYLGMRTAPPELCARFLGKAADIRARSRAPLFSFWIPHNEEAMNWARARLPNERFEACYRAGASARDEVVINEAGALLRQVAEA